MQNTDPHKCRRAGCQFDRPLKPRKNGGTRRVNFCSAACATVVLRARRALHTKDADEVAELMRLFKLLDARTSPRGFIPGLFTDREEAA